MDRRHQEVRVHVPDLVCQVLLIFPKQQEWDVIRREADILTSAFVIVGAVVQDGAWRLSLRLTHVDGKRFLLAALVVAINVLHLERVACVRACRGVFCIFVLSKFASCEVLACLRGNDTDDIVLFIFEAGDLCKPFPAKALP